MLLCGTKRERITECISSEKQCIKTKKTFRKLSNNLELLTDLSKVKYFTGLRKDN